MKGLASSFADHQDNLVYQRALITHLRGGASQELAEARARKVGDPGVGWVDNDLHDGQPWIALPYEDWQTKWGTKRKAHRKPVLVMIKGKTVRCLLGDTMPHKANIRNGAVIDLAPGAQEAFGLTAPFLVPCSWEWA